jgi:hypothetical protein
MSDSAFSILVIPSRRRRLSSINSTRIFGTCYFPADNLFIYDLRNMEIRQDSVKLKMTLTFPKVHMPQTLPWGGFAVAARLSAASGRALP